MSKKSQTGPIADLYAAAVKIVSGTRQVFKEHGEDARELRLPIVMKGTDMRVTIEAGPTIAARNAIEHAQMSASGRPAADGAKPVALTGWTEKQTMAAIRATNSFGSVKLTSKHGPYDIDRPTFHCDRLVEFIVAQRDAQWLAASAPAQAGASAMPADERKDKADELLTAAHAFWNSERNAGQQGAVKWVQGDDGALVIFTRGEYRHELMTVVTGPTDQTHAFGAPASAIAGETAQPVAWLESEPSTKDWSIRNLFFGLSSVAYSSRIHFGEKPKSIGAENRLTPLYAGAPVALSGSAQAGAGDGWISVEDGLPTDAEPVLIYTPAGKYGKVWIDTWQMQSEAPVSFSSATIETGFMWDEHEFEEVSHWQPLPAPPAGLSGSAQGGGDAS